MFFRRADDGRGAAHDHRLSPEQLYTINHAEADIILVNNEFLPVLEQIWERVEWTERPLAVVVVEPERHVGEAEIKAHLQDFAARGVISKYGVPDRIVFVDLLPKTSVGKLDKKVLRQKYSEGGASQ